MGVRGLGGLLNPGHIGGFIAKGNVRLDGIVKKQILLPHQSNQRPPRIRLHRGKLLAIDQNTPFLGLYKSADQIHHRGLTRTGDPYQGNRFPLPAIKAQIPKNPGFSVAKTHILKFQTHFEIVQRLGMGTIDHLRYLIQ